MRLIRLTIGMLAVLSASVVLAPLPGCGGRYQINLWLVSERPSGERERSKIDVEETAFAPATRLNDPHSTPNVIPGDQSTVVVSVGTRGEAIRGKGMDLALGFDQYLKYRIYLQLPPAALSGPDTVVLAGNSFVRLMKFYEIPPSEKTFLPVGEAGRFIVDSVASGNLFGTFENAFWENSKGTRVGFEGRLKFKVR